MGCSQATVLNFISQNTKSSQIQTTSYDFEKSKIIYDKAKDSFFNLFDEESIEIINKISEGPVDKIEEGIKSLWKEKKKSIRKNEKIDYETLENIVLIELSRKYLLAKGKSFISETDLFSLFESKIKFQFLLKAKDGKTESFSEKQLKFINSFLEENEIYFPRKQKVMTFYLEKHFPITRYYKSSIYEHFLFSEEFKPESLNVYFTPLLFKYDIMIDILSEIIRNKSLYFLNVIVHSVQNNDTERNNYLDSFNFDNNMYGKLLQLLNSAKENKSLKVLSLSMSKPFKIVMPPECSNIILEILKKDNLIGLWLGKFIFSNEFYSLLENILASLKKLIFLGINSKYVSEEGLISLNNIISKNSSIKVFVLAGVNYSYYPTEFDGLKLEIEGSKHMEMFYYNKSLLNIEYIDSDEPPKTGGMLI